MPVSGVGDLFWDYPVVQIGLQHQTMASYEKLKTRTRDDYHFILDYRTRWADNDQYVILCETLQFLWQ